MTTNQNIEDYFEKLQARGEFADDEEEIHPDELAEAEAAYQDYLAGRDPGSSEDEIKHKLFGKRVG